jgi:hypothetical protein
LGYRSLLIEVCCDASLDLVVEPFRFSIAYLDSDIAGKRESEIHNHLVIWHWPENDVSILPIVTSIINTNISSIWNAAITNVQDPSWNIRELLGC